MTLQRQNYRFVIFVAGVYVWSNFRKKFHICKANTNIDKSAF